MLTIDKIRFKNNFFLYFQLVFRDHERLNTVCMFRYITRPVFYIIIRSDPVSGESE